MGYLGSSSEEIRPAHCDSVVCNGPLWSTCLLLGRRPVLHIAVVLSAMALCGLLVFSFEEARSAHCLTVPRNGTWTAVPFRSRAGMPGFCELGVWGLAFSFSVRVGDYRHCRCRPWSAPAMCFCLWIPGVSGWVAALNCMGLNRTLASPELGEVCGRSCSVSDRLWTLWCAGSSL